MARMRTIKPALRTSTVVARWPLAVRYAWVLLWGYLDDEGRGLDIPKTIAGDLFPLDEDITARVVDDWLTTMSTAPDEEHGAPLCRYSVAGRSYIHAPNWREHQKPNRPSPSQHPRCPLHDGTLDHTANSVNGSVSHSSLEGLRVREFESLKGDARGCPAHPDGTRKPCRACGEIRLRRENGTTTRVRRHGYIDDGSGACAGCRLPQTNRAHKGAA